MSTNDPNAYGRTQQEPEYRPDYTRPIARAGEQQFAAIVRQRSGFDAGNIDFGLRPLKGYVDDSELQDFADTAYALYESICHDTGKRAKRDQP